MGFIASYPVPLRELLLSPVVFRDTQPACDDMPLVSGALLHDLCSHFGHGAGAVRTALSRLRAAESIELVEAKGTTRYRLGALGRSVAMAVRDRPERPEGFVIAIFSFATADAKERHVVRETLKLHGFQKLAQNVYINGAIDTTEIERVMRDHGLSQHVFFFRCDDAPDVVRDSHLREIFGIPRRARELARFEKHLRAFLGERGLSRHERARRYLFAAPTHYRTTFVDEPPLPLRCLPADYPLARLESLGQLSPQRVLDLRAYFSAFEP